MLAIAGGKGGCGKTTTAIGLATAFVTAGRRPLVVDADLGMPDLHTRLGLDREPGLGDVLAGYPIRTVSRTSSSRPGVTVCPAGDAEPPIAPALERVREWSGPVLVDCPAGASPDAAEPLRVADRTVVVTTAAPNSLEDAAKTAAMARALDAPPCCAVVRGDPPLETVRRLLGCGRVVNVPRVGTDPLDHPVVSAGYDRLQDVLRPAPGSRFEPSDEPGPVGGRGKRDRGAAACRRNL